MKKCPYELLGVARDADTKTIKKSYRKLMMKYHEDRVTNQVKSKGLDGTPEGQKMIEDAKEMASALNVAENILTDTTEYETNSGKKYTKREVYDKYGHSGLEALQNGDDPAQTTGTVRQGKHSWEEAVETFGGRRDPTEGVSVEDLLDGAFEPNREKRNVDDILRDAKHAEDTRYDADIDELLEEATSIGKGRNRKPKKSSKNSQDVKKSINDITDKLGGIFGRAKKKAEEMMSSADEIDIGVSDNSDKIAADILDVVGDLAASGGNLSKEELTSVITRLTSIANEVQSNGNKPKNGRGFGR